MALALLIAVTALAGLAVAWPIVERHTANIEQLANQQLRLARFTEYLAATTDTMKQPRDTDHAAQPRMYLKGESDAQRSATLQQIVANAIDNYGTKPRAVRPISTEPVMGMRRSGIQVELTTELSKLISIIATIIERDERLSIEIIRIAPIAPKDVHRRDIVDARIAILGYVEPEIALQEDKAR